MIDIVDKNNSFRSNKRLILLVFTFFLLVYIVSSDGHYDPWDGKETFLVTEGMAIYHSAKLYPNSPSAKELYFDPALDSSFHIGLQLTHNTVDISQPSYIRTSLLLSAIAVPFYYAAVLFSVSPISVVSLFVNPIILAFTSVIIFCFALQVYRSKGISFILSLVFGVCSFAWSYNSSLIPQPLQGLCLIASAFFIYVSTGATKTRINNYSTSGHSRKGIYLAALAGLFLGLSVFAHPTSVIMIPGFIVYSIFLMRHNMRMKNLMPFLIALTITIVFYGVTNNWRFGSFTQAGYGNTVPAHQGWKGLVGLLVSPGSGLIFYFPVVILLPIALKDLYQENKSIVFISIYVMIASWLFFGTISASQPSSVAENSWFGSEGWGPRYLVPTLPFITLALGALLRGLQRGIFMKISMTVFCVIGFCVSLLGILVWWLYGFGYGWNIEELWRLDRVASNVSNVDMHGSYTAMVWLPYYSPIVLHTKALLSNFVSSDIQPTQHYWNDWGRLGLAPCSYNIYLFCKFGITPILLLSGLITVIAIIIIMEINKINPRAFVSSLKNHIKQE